MRRTKKTFTDYNDYHDRGIKKWTTAFNMDELASSIKKNAEEALKDIPLLPEMSYVDIDDVLTQAFTRRIPVEVQTYEKDSLGRQVENYMGYFFGIAYDDEVRIGDRFFFYNEIRHMRLADQNKWSDLEIFNLKNKKDILEDDPFAVAELTVDNTYNQDYMWIEG